MPEDLHGMVIDIAIDEKSDTTFMHFGFHDAKSYEVRAVGSKLREDLTVLFDINHGGIVGLELQNYSGTRMAIIRETRSRLSRLEVCCDMPALTRLQAVLRSEVVI